MLIRAFSAFFLFCCTLCFASEPLETHDALLTEIVSNNCECVVNVTDDKVYVNPERIYPTSQGLFLCVGTDEYVPLPLLLSDDQGCYIQTGWIKVTSPCKFCGWERVSGGWKCPNQNCSSNQPKQDKPKDKPKAKPKK